MGALTFPIAYLGWHYTIAYHDIFRVWTNFMWFVYHLFSVPVLLRSLFSPWKRMDMRYQKGLNIEDWAGTFVVNIMMRIVGAIARFVIILIGTLGLIIFGIGGLCILLVWALLPFAVLLLPILGVISIFT